MTSRADRLLCCAVAYRNAHREGTRVPETFESETAGVSAMMSVLWFEAERAMNESIAPPEEPYLYPVDIDTDEPGIVASKEHQSNILRRKLPLPSVAYGTRPAKPTSVQSVQVRPASPPRNLQQANEDAEKRARKLILAEQRQAKRDLKAEATALERREAAEEKKRKRAEETAEEREARLAEQREKREAKKLEREALKAAEELAEAGEDEEGSAEDGAVDQSSEQVEEDEAKDGQELTVQEALERESVVAAHDAKLPRRLRAREKKAKFFPSPVPHDRHLTALEQTRLHANIRVAVLQAKPTSSLKIVHGPPGTGKTRQLASMIELYPNERIFACAPTNVGTANLYGRILDVEPEASLLLPPSKIPPGVPIVSQDPSARVVCSTISGRSGPLLDAEQFGIVMVDEAAQCMEAWIWCLLREDVHTLVLVGDAQQLPALVSEDGESLQHGRSMMERLQSRGYPCEFLQTQRRMHPEIVRFPNERFYHGRLLSDYSPPAGDTPPYKVVEVDGMCEAIGHSYVNREEVRVCAALVEELEAHFDKVVVISPYQAQTREFLALGLTHVHTVDSFQGQEADAVVLSVVRREDIGFWKDERRLNVALTRARHCLRIVGASHTWTGVLGSLRDDASDRDLIVQGRQ